MTRGHTWSNKQSWGGGNGGYDARAWGGSKAATDTGATQKPWQPKNWCCEACGNTNNAHWWWTCGRDTCGAEWTPKVKDEAGAAASQETAAANELNSARDELKSLVVLLPEGHATILEYADRVRKLEEAQKTGVSTAERLRRLLQAQKQNQAKQTAAVAAMNKAKTELTKATEVLKERMEECDRAIQEIAANTLEIAEVTRSAAPASRPDLGPTNMCQDLRQQFDTLTPTDLAEAGTDMAGMGQFFVMFGKIMALLERAKTREEAVDPPVITSPAAPAAASAVSLNLLQPSEIPPGQPNPFTQVLPVDDEDEDSEEDDDATMTGEGAAKRELAKAEKLVEGFKTAEVGSCG